MIPTIPYLRLRLTLEAQAHACLPSFKGSLLRGAFGHALRRSVCAMGRDQACDGCRLRRACVYTRIFETFIEETPPPFLRGIPTSPRPYVFEPAAETRDFAPGDPLDFDLLLLLGQATDLHAYTQLAVERMAAVQAEVGRYSFTVRLSHPQHLAGFDRRTSQPCFAARKKRGCKTLDPSPRVARVGAFGVALASEPGRTARIGQRSPIGLFRINSAALIGPQGGTARPGPCPFRPGKRAA